MPDGFAKALAAGHLAVGVGALLLPLKTCDVFGVRPVRSQKFITRLFGSRDVVLAWALLNASSAAEQKLALIMANVINAVDVVSGIVTYFEKDLSDKGFILGSGGAFALLSLGLFSIKRQRLI